MCDERKQLLAVLKCFLRGLADVVPLQRPLCHDQRYVSVAAAVCDYEPSPPKSQELVKVSPGKALRASSVSHKVACN